MAGFRFWHFFRLSFRALAFASIALILSFGIANARLMASHVFRIASAALGTRKSSALVFVIKVLYHVASQ
ncbi:MAG: hypothetical protein ABSB42_08495 [Tepidisphaeraceae bacterium]|jgi:hypothetical protein